MFESSITVKGQPSGIRCNHIAQSRQGFAGSKGRG